MIATALLTINAVTNVLVMKIANVVATTIIAIATMNASVAKANVIVATNVNVITTNAVIIARVIRIIVIVQILALAKTSVNAPKMISAVTNVIAIKLKKNAIATLKKMKNVNAGVVKV